MRISRSLLTLLLLLSLSPALTAQEERSTQQRTFPRLYRAGNGYVGFSSGTGVTTISRYDSALTRLTERPFRSFAPQDYYGLRGPVGDTVGFLLANPGTATLLYRLELSGMPELIPIWQQSLFPYREILGGGDFDTDGNHEVIIAGDSAVTVIDVVSREADLQLRGAIVDAYLVQSAEPTLLILERVGSRLDLAAVDLRTMSPGTRRTIATEGSGMIGYDRRRDQIVIITESPSSLYRFDITKESFSDPVPLPGFPDHILHSDRREPIQLLWFSTPSPTLGTVGESLELRELRWSTSRVPRTAGSTAQLLVLVTQDSALLYDREGELVAVQRSPGYRGPLLLPAQTARTVLLSTESGSVMLQIERRPWDWIVQLVPWIILALILVLLIALMVVAWRRFRSIRMLHNNLVHVPEADGVVVLGRNQRVRTMNRSARHFLAADPLIPVGRHISGYLPEDLSDEIEHAMRRLFAEGVPFERQQTLTIGGAARTISFRGRPMTGRYGAAGGYLLLIEDLTATVERERLINWASVAHHIAHEMKTPLGTVRATAETLKNRLIEAGEFDSLAPAATRILNQAEKLRAIVNDLLSVARTEELQTIEADIALLLSTVVDEFSEYLPPTIELRMETEGTGFRAEIDVDQLSVAVRNLLDNARQAIGQRSNGAIVLKLVSRDRNVQIMVRDNGIGMDESTLAHLFQPYFTRKEGGSGIGTVIIKRVAEAHGGEVQVESTPGIGTTFSLTIPRKQSN